jgi:hypothetical protein
MSCSNIMLAVNKNNRRTGGHRDLLLPIGSAGGPSREKNGERGVAMLLEYYSRCAELESRVAGENGQAEGETQFGYSCIMYGI